MEPFAVAKEEAEVNLLTWCELWFTLFADGVWDA